MDVGNPSNFIRIQELFNKNLSSLKKSFSSYSFSDDETKIMMKSIHDKFNYISEPHGVIGYLGLKKYGLKTNEFGVFLETAHPVKFLEVVEETLKVDVEIPSQIKEVMSREKVATSIANYQELKLFLNR
jgi:threonine synthase